MSYGTASVFGGHVAILAPNGTGNFAELHSLPLVDTGIETPYKSAFEWGG